MTIRSSLDLDSQIQGSVTCVLAHNLPQYFAGGCVGGMLPQFGGKREGLE